MTSLTLSILEIRKETSDSSTICFKQPTLKKIKYKPGQYLSLIFIIKGRRYIRPYSISSAFGIDQTIDVTIKRVQGGIVSNHIIDNLKVNDIVECMSPMGDFILPDDMIDIEEVFLWGTGSGITPLFSIAKHLLFHDRNVKVNLVYGIRKFEDVIFSRQLDILLRDYSERFNLNKCISGINFSNEEHVFAGRIDPVKQLADIELSKTGLHYICGPKSLKENICDYLLVAGVQRENIYVEDFELTLCEEDLTGVTTQDVIIEFNREIKSVKVLCGKSILEAGLDMGLELPYSCQIGDCDSCKAEVSSGSVRQIRPKRSSQKNNEYLMCCSYPLTADVQITYEI